MNLDRAIAYVRATWPDHGAASGARLDSLDGMPCAIVTTNLGECVVWQESDGTYYGEI